jgi:hypothetical protein
MPRDGAACRGAGPDPERSELIARAAHRAPDAWLRGRRASVALAVLLVTGVVAAAACRSARSHRRPRSAEVATVAREATGLVEERLEGMSTEELIKLAKKLQGEVLEIDDDMDLSVEKDPCKGNAWKRTPSKNAKIRLAEMESEKEEKEEVEGLLEEEIEEIEDEEDPCSMPEEAVLKVEEIFDEEIEATEAESQGALDEEDTKLKNLRGSIETKAKGSQSSNASDVSQTGNSSVANGPTETELSIKDLNLTHRHIEPPASAKCSASHEDCRTTMCCSDPGLQCYEKNKWWAMCRAQCIPGVADPADVDSEHWSCKKFGERSPGKPVNQEECHDVNSNCMDSKCCSDPGFACFAKNDTFARCMPECAPGPQYFDLEDSSPWRCHQLGAAALSTVGNWSEASCSGDVDDCRKSRCCATSGLQCYEMGSHWAQCRASCSQEEDEPSGRGLAWTCKKLGYRTPPPPTELPNGPLGGKVGRWVKDSCSKDGEDCSSTSCCVGRGRQCYQKDSAYATCADECQTNGTWSCKELGTRSWGLAYVGYPSLFCFSLFRVDSYELELVEYQWKRRAGIFACDNFRLFSDTATTIAGRETLVTPKVEIGVSKDGTAGNAELFMKVWEMVFTDGTVWEHDWTVKADPDAVLLSDRLRWRLEPHTNNWNHSGRLFVINCNAWPSAYDFPMMYGSVEIFSQGAMSQYMAHAEQCKKSLPWQEWGEDFFMTRCMDQADVGRIEDFDLVGDNVCVGPGQNGSGECDDSGRAAFHPFKDIESWERCFKNAIR